MKKFELTTESKTFFGRTLFRIRACMSFGVVVEGELGGWIEKEENLSSDGNAWVSGDAEVSGNAEVYGNARVSGNAWVYGNALVSGNAEVSGNARVSGNAWVYGNAWVSGDARVSGNAEVSGDAEVSPINIIGLAYNVTITDTHMRIGCEFHSHDDWRGFDNEHIAQMDGASARRFWDAHRETLLALCTFHAAKVAELKAA